MQIWPRILPKSLYLESRYYISNGIAGALLKLRNTLYCLLIDLKPYVRSICPETFRSSGGSSADRARALTPYPLLVRPGSPGSRLARLPGEGGQYAKTSNTQITAKICMGKFDTPRNHGFLALNFRGEKF
jgi:hypothetical protein